MKCFQNMLAYLRNDEFRFALALVPPSRCRTGFSSFRIDCRPPAVPRFTCFTRPTCIHGDQLATDASRGSAVVLPFHPQSGLHKPGKQRGHEAQHRGAKRPPLRRWLDPRNQHPLRSGSRAAFSALSSGK